MSDIVLSFESTVLNLQFKSGSQIKEWMDFV